jgi:hypothetical protein
MGNTALPCSEEEEEGAHDWKHDGDGVSERHRDHPILPHEEVADNRYRNDGIEQRRCVWIQPSLKKPTLQQVH